MLKFAWMRKCVISIVVSIDATGILAVNRIREIEWQARIVESYHWIY